jgi:hypothetical protein
MKIVCIAGVVCLSAQAAAAFSVPGCDTLAGWIATDGAPVEFNAAGPVPPAYGAGATAAVFGTPFLDWTAADVRALDGALNACRSEANRARDTALTATFTEARRDLSDVGRRLRDRAAAREAVDGALAAIGAATPSAALGQSLAALAAAPEGALAQVRETTGETRPIARFGDRLTGAEGLALRDVLAERAGAVQRQLAEDAGAALAATPATLEGILALRQQVIDAQVRMGDGAAGVAAAAAAREAEIAAALAAADPAPVTLPACADLVAWGAGLSPQDSRRTPAGIVVTGLEAPELEALFGKPFHRWDAADIDAMGRLAAQCREAGRAGLLGGEPQAMMRAGQNVVILHAQSGNQPPIFAALAASRGAVDEIVAEAASAPGGAEGFAALAALRQRVGSLDEADAARATAALESRRAAIAEAEIARIEAGMAAAPATLDGLFGALDAGFGALVPPFGLDLTEAERAGLREATFAAAARLVPGALPELEAQLAALPETEAGLAEAEAIVGALPPDLPVLAPLRAAAEARAAGIGSALLLAALPEFEAEIAALPDDVDSLAHLLAVGATAAANAGERPGYEAYAGAALVRATALRGALAEARCAPTLAGLSASDAARPVLVGTAVLPLGRLLCAMEADAPPRYAAPGFFGSRHTVEATVMGGYAVKLVLVESATPQGGKALIGQRIEDGEGARDVSVAEWQAWSGSLEGGAGACAFMAEVFAESLAGGWGAEALAGDLARCLVAHPEAPIPIAG